MGSYLKEARRQSLSAYYLALCSELEREVAADGIKTMSTPVLKQNIQDAEERLRERPNGDERVKNAKANIGYWEDFLEHDRA